MGTCSSSYAFGRGNEDGLRRSIRLYEVREISSKVNVFNRNRCFQTGESPMTLAASEGHEAIVARLVRSGASVNRMDKNGKRPLHVAVLKNDIETVKVLLLSGADPNRCDGNLTTPLQIACDRGYADIVQTLISGGAVDKHFPSTLHPLILAVRARHSECAELLLDNRTPSFVDDGKGNTALSLAVQNNDLLSVMTLVQHDAVRHILVTPNNVANVSPDKLAKNNGRLVCLSILNKSPQILKILLNAKCPYDVTDDVPHPLIAATITGNVECLEVLLNTLQFKKQNNLPVDATDRRGESALMLSVMALIDSERANYYCRYFSNVYRSFAVYDPMIFSQERMIKCVMELVETGFNIEPVWDKFIEHFPSPTGITFEQMVLCEVLLQAYGLRNQPEHRLRNFSLSLLRLGEYGLVRLLHSAGKNPSTAEAVCLRADSNDENERMMHAGISHLLVTPRNLKDMCRRSVRRILSRNVLFLCQQLPISSENKDYICIMDTKYYTYGNDFVQQSEC